MERWFWREIIENRYTLPEEYSLGELTDELLDYLYSTDPELRDTFAYNILARWVIIYGIYSPDELMIMLDWLTPKLTEGLGEQNSDSVFIRSYAALILSLIVYRDSQTGFLTEAETRSLLDKARHCLLAEQDLRAYVPEKGWANACGHTADLLKFLARSKHLEMADLVRLLDAVADKLMLDTGYVYTHDEDDRLAQVAVAILRRDLLNVEDVQNWLQRFHNWKSGQVTVEGQFNPSYHAPYQNVKNFLRSLYFQMQLASYLPVASQNFQTELLEAIRAFSL